MRKKLFAVIMSAMMMITFMPAMAFAAITDVDWNSDFTSVSYKDGNTGKSSSAIRYGYFYNAGTSGPVGYGQSSAIPFEHVDNYSGYIHAVATKDGNVSADAIDFSFASAKVDGLYVDEGDKLAWDDAVSLMDGTVAVQELTFGIPSYIDNYDAYDNAKVVAGDDFGGYEVAAKISDYDMDKKYEAQTMTISYQVTCPNQATADKKLGMMKSVSFTIKAKEADVEKTTYKLSDAILNPAWVSTQSEVGDNGILKAYYDGASHEVQQVEMPGVTSKFEMWDEEKAAFVEVSGAATVKDVDTYTFRATATDGKKTDVKVFYVNIKESGSIEYNFDSVDVYSIGNISYRVDDLRTTYITGTNNAFYVGSNYNPVDFVSVKNSATEDNQKKAFDKAKEADKEAIKAYFNDFYEVKQTETTYDKGIFNATIADKDLSALTSVEKNELKAKHKALVGNYGNPSVASSTKATFYVKDNVKFTKAPLNKTFKAKNGKLAKNKTFKVTAKADSGAKVTYKIANGGSRIVINKNTGKVTLKKGLKKRTYNIKITASAGTYIGTDKSFTCKIKVK